MVMGLCEVAGVPVSFEPSMREAVVPVLRGASALVRGLEAIGEFRSWRLVRACGVASHDRLMTMHEGEVERDRMHPRWLRVRALCQAMGRLRPW